jgi:hypothetical protein
MSSTKPVFLSEALRELRAHFGEDITIPHMLSLSIGRETAPGADSVVDGAPVKLPPWYWGCLHDWSPENDAAEFTLGRIRNRQLNTTQATSISWSEDAWSEVRSALPPPLADERRGFVDRLLRLRAAENGAHLRASYGDATGNITSQQTEVTNGKRRDFAIEDQRSEAKSGASVRSGRFRIASTDLNATLESLPAEIIVLAEWIFVRDPRSGAGGKLQTFEKLLSAARRDPELKTFTYKAFLAAYHAVYQTKSHRGPAEGWPLREPFLSRINNGQKI